MSAHLGTADEQLKALDCSVLSTNVVIKFNLH